MFRTLNIHILIGRTLDSQVRGLGSVITGGPASLCVFQYVQFILQKHVKTFR